MSATAVLRRVTGADRDLPTARNALPIGGPAYVVANSFDHVTPTSLPGRVVTVTKVKRWAPCLPVVVVRAETPGGASALFRPSDLAVPRSV